MRLTGVVGVHGVAPAVGAAAVLLVAVLGGVLVALLAELVELGAEFAGVRHIADSSMAVAPGQVLGHGGEGTAFEAAVGAVRPLAVAEGGVHSMRHPDMVLHSTKLRGTYVPRVRHVCSTCRKVSTYVVCIRGTYAAPYLQGSLGLERPSCTRTHTCHTRAAYGHIRGAYVATYASVHTCIVHTCCICTHT